MLQQKKSTKTSGVHLPPHPHTPKLLWNCCERTHGPSVAFPSNVKWHSPASSSDVQQPDVLHGPRKVTAVTLGWSTCSRSCCPFAVVTSTRNSRQVALRTTLGLLMQSIRKRSARPYDRTDLLVMTESTNNKKIWIELTTQTCA